MTIMYTPLPSIVGRNGDGQEADSPGMFMRHVSCLVMCNRIDSVIIVSQKL